VYFVLYEVANLIYIFGITALFFGAFALYGRFAKADLSRLRPLLIGVLIFLLIAVLLLLMNTYPLLMSQNLMFRSQQTALENQALLIANSLTTADSLTPEDMTEWNAVITAEAETSDTAPGEKKRKRK